jgi:cobalamin biosynthesis protein CobD/CbiB
VANIDGELLTAEVGILLALAAQVVLAAIGTGAAYLVGRRGARAWKRVGFVWLVAAAAVASGWTLTRCREARAEVRGRMEGTVIGPHMSSDRAENALARVAWYSVLSVGLAAVMVGGGWRLGRTSHQHHCVKHAKPRTATDGGA